jgi:hypothetical protein
MSSEWGLRTWIFNSFPGAAAVAGLELHFENHVFRPALPVSHLSWGNHKALLWQPWMDSKESYTCLVACQSLTYTDMHEHAHTHTHTHTRLWGQPWICSLLKVLANKHGSAFNGHLKILNLPLLLNHISASTAWMKSPMPSDNERSVGPQRWHGLLTLGSVLLTELHFPCAPFPGRDMEAGETPGLLR